MVNVYQQQLCPLNLHFTPGTWHQAGDASGTRSPLGNEPSIYGRVHLRTLNATSSGISGEVDRIFIQVQAQYQCEGNFYAASSCCCPEMAAVPYSISLLQSTVDKAER